MSSVSTSAQLSSSPNGIDSAQAEISPLNIAALVQLRALLIHAKEASRKTTPLNRVVAVILLDAVNERVTHLAATSLGVEVGARPTFEELYSRVKQKLGEQWRTSAWSDVRRLHRQRNNAQHEAVGADREDIAGWAAATERYTKSLVDAVFRVNLDEVVLAEAVNDPALRELLKTAELSLRNGEIQASIEAIREAFLEARERWHAQHRRGPFHTRRLRPYRPLDRPAFEYLEELATAALEYNAEQVFGGDPAEYLWFRQAIQDDPRTISYDEAQRALAFAFWWIVGWEAVTSSFIPDRYRRWQESQRKVRAADGPARIDKATVECHVMNGGSEISWMLKFSLVDLPPSDSFDEWNSHLCQILWNANTPDLSFQGITPTGEIRLAVPDIEKADVDEIVKNVTHALTLVEEKMRESRRLAQLSQERNRKLNSEYKKALEAARDRLPPWVEDIRLDERGNAVLVRLDPLTTQHFCAEARTRTQVEACYPCGRNEVLIRPVLNAEDLVSLVQDCGPAVDSTIAAISSEREKYESIKVRAEARLQAAVELARISEAESNGAL